MAVQSHLGEMSRWVSVITRLPKRRPYRMQQLRYMHDYSHPSLAHQHAPQSPKEKQQIHSAQHQLELSFSAPEKFKLCFDVKDMLPHGAKRRVRAYRAKVDFFVMCLRKLAIRSPQWVGWNTEKWRRTLECHFDCGPFTESEIDTFFQYAHRIGRIEYVRLLYEQSDMPGLWREEMFILISTVPEGSKERPSPEPRFHIHEKVSRLLNGDFLEGMTESRLRRSNSLEDLPFPVPITRFMVDDKPLCTQDGRYRHGMMKRLELKRLMHLLKQMEGEKTVFHRPFVELHKHKWDKRPAPDSARDKVSRRRNQTTTD